MPLLLCPNDNSSMQKVHRDGVDLDICPSCKGVWLDRGELDKLLNAERSESEELLRKRQRFEQEVQSFERNPEQWRKEHPVDARTQRHRYDGDFDDDDDDYRRSGKRRRKRDFDLFDIFDL